MITVMWWILAEELNGDPFADLDHPPRGIKRIPRRFRTPGSDAQQNRFGTSSRNFIRRNPIHFSLWEFLAQGAKPLPTLIRQTGLLLIIVFQYNGNMMNDTALERRIWH